MRKKIILLSGQTIIELLLALSLTGVFLPVLITSFTSSREGRAQDSQRITATQLQREAIEAVRSVRERGWNEIAQNGDYHPVVTGTQWELDSGTEVIGDFTRVITISDAYRDVSGALVQTSGISDPATKKIVLSISWNKPRSGRYENTLYLSRNSNDVFFETLESEFLEGEPLGTVITHTQDGEVILGAGGHGDWCAPEVAQNGVNLTGQGIALGVTAIEGEAFVGTGENASGLSFMNVTVDNNDPPLATQAGNFNGYKTNDVFGEESYGYISTDTNSKEVVIINTTTNPFTESGFVDLPGNGDGESVFVADSVGYATSGNALYNFNLSSKIGSRPILDLNGVTLSGTANRVIVRGDYAYVAVDGSPELQIVDVSNQTNLTVVGQADVNSAGAVDVFANESGTRTYVAAKNSASQRELFIIDVSTKTGNRPLLGSYDSNSMDPKGISVATGNRAVLVGIGAEEYQVIDLSLESTPVRCGGAQVNEGVNAVAAVLESDSDAYSYIVTNNADSEFRIIAGGPGGSFVDDGVFISGAFDAVQSVMFNRLVPNVTLPPTTDARFQIAVTDPINNSCADATYSFIGPDGTDSTNYTTTGGQIPISSSAVGYKNPARCFKYKSFLTTGDYTATPIINSVSLNYSL